MRRSKKLRQGDADGRKGDAVEPRNPGAFVRKVMRLAALKPLRVSSHGEPPGLDQVWTSERRQGIIASYLETLDSLKSPIRSESELPHSKQAIQTAIVEELVTNPETELRGHLEVAYAEIESFIPAEEYELLQSFKESCSRAEQLAERGDRRGILACSRLMDRSFGEKAVGVLERVSYAMREQLKKIQSIELLHTSMGFDNASSS